ncbi:hypothetical protein R1sor_013049 [Riccia sorocarpa]|uniref:ACT domain-containing protein n=1 Tax=Riccia sorocarpa TaxID=122646 RepID=A0ABD3H8Q1_9MARC
MVVWAAGYYNGPVLENGETPLPSSAVWNERKARRRVLEELQALPEERLTSDLSNTEWFYLISSKIQFPFGQDGTPAKMLLTGGLEWVCDGDEINGAMSSRTDLIKTILCLNVTGGVVEIGTTSLIEQNMQLIHFVRNMFERGTQKVQTVSSLLGHDQTDDHVNNNLLFSPSSTASKFSSQALTSLGMSSSSAGPGLGLAPPYQPNLTSLGTPQQISFGLDSLPFAPSLLNGLLREQGPELNLQQAAAATGGGSWDVSVEQHLMQEQNMIPANLKHKLTGPTAALTRSGSCVASLEQALLPRAQSISQRGALHVESTGKLLSDFQAQLFNQPHIQQQQRNLVQTSTDSVVSDSPRHSPPVVPQLLDSMKAASKSPHEIHWRAVNTQAQGMASPPKLLRVESGGNGVAEFSQLDSTSCFKSHQRGGPSKDIHQHKFTDLLPGNSNHTHGQQTQFLAELTGEAHTGHSGDHSWSSEAISPTISEQDQAPEDGFSLWEDNENLENGRFLDDSMKQRRSKRARLCGLNINANQSPVSTNDFGIFLDYNMNERKRQESEKLQALRRMLQPHSASKCENGTVPGDAMEHMRVLQRTVKESESATTSSASEDGQNHRSLERTSSPATSLVQEVNPLSMKRDFNNQSTAAMRQQQYGISGGGDNGPLLKLSDVCLDTNEELDGIHLGIVDDIPQIEVRMMENDHVMIKFSTKDRPNLFTDIMFALQDLRLQVQHANIRTVHGVVHDVFAAKVDVALLEKQSTHIIAEVIRQAIEKGHSPSSSSPNPATPDAFPNVHSPRKRLL